jgi:hypothetical protein
VITGDVELKSGISQILGMGKVLQNKSWSITSRFLRLKARRHSLATFGRELYGGCKNDASLFASPYVDGEPPMEVAVKEDRVPLLSRDGVNMARAKVMIGKIQKEMDLAVVSTVDRRGVLRQGDPPNRLWTQSTWTRECSELIWRCCH